jgi:hypothetical protein
MDPTLKSEIDPGIRDDRQGGLELFSKRPWSLPPVTVGVSSHRIGGVVEGPAVSPTGTAGPSLAYPAIPFLLVGEGRLAGHAHPSVMDDPGRIMKHSYHRVKKCSGAWQAN